MSYRKFVGGQDVTDQLQDQFCCDGCISPMNPAEEETIRIQMTRTSKDASRVNDTLTGDVHNRHDCIHSFVDKLAQRQQIHKD
jgi:hypothetical protein